MKIALIILLSVCALWFILGALLMLKNLNTLDQRSTIIRAIHLYHLECIRSGQRDNFKVNYEDKEPYEKTFWRLWDWGYKRILPPDKFEIIKPYIIG